MKTLVPPLLAALLLLAPAGARSAATGCCAEAPAAPLPARSLYQTEGRFTDDAGRPVQLRELRGRPVLITLFFASCGYACPLLAADMARIRDLLPADLRDRPALVLVSFDTDRDTPAALHDYRSQRRLDAQWTLLHGNEADVRELAALLGVRYERQAGGMFAHTNLITVLNADGEIVHQRRGLEGGLAETAAALAACARQP